MRPVLFTEWGAMGDAPVAADDDRAYVAMHSRIVMLDPARALDAEPVWTSPPSGRAIRHIDAAGGLVVAAGTMLDVYQREDGPSDGLRLTATLPLRSGVVDVLLVGEQVWVLTPDRLLRRWSLRDPWRPQALPVWRPPLGDHPSRRGAVVAMHRASVADEAWLLVGWRLASVEPAVSVPELLRVSVATEPPAPSDPRLLEFDANMLAARGSRVVVARGFGPTRAQMLELDELGGWGDTQELAVSRTDGLRGIALGDEHLWYIGSSTFRQALQPADAPRIPTALSGAGAWVTMPDGRLLVRLSESLRWLDGVSAPIPGPTLSFAGIAALAPAPGGLWILGQNGAVFFDEGGRGSPRVVLPAVGEADGRLDLHSQSDALLVMHARSFRIMSSHPSGELETIRTIPLPEGMPPGRILAATAGMVLSMETTHDPIEVLYHGSGSSGIRHGRLFERAPRGVFGATIDGPRLWLRTAVGLHSWRWQSAAFDEIIDIPLPGSSPGSAAVNDNLAIVGLPNAITLLDVTDPERLVELFVLDLPGSPDHIIRDGHIAWIAWSNSTAGPTVGGITALDVSAPTRLRWLGDVPFSPADIRDMSATDGQLWLLSKGTVHGFRLATPQPTPTPAATRTPTREPTPTVTPLGGAPSSTGTPVRTATAAPTRTPSPTPTSTPAPSSTPAPPTASPPRSATPAAPARETLWLPSSLRP